MGCGATQIECQGRILRLQRSKIRIVAVLNITRCVEASRQTISRGTKSTFDWIRGESKARGEFVGSSAQKSELLRSSISLAASLRRGISSDF